MALIDMIKNYQELLEKKESLAEETKKQQRKDRSIKTGYRTADD